MKIFVVDDERIIRVSLADELRDANHEVHECSDASAALMLLREQTPDLVITDYKMPGLNGIELLTKIKEQNESIYVILMTAFSTVDNAIKAMKIGAYDYIQKPFDNEEMLFIVDRIKENIKLKKENKVLKKRVKDFGDFSNYVGSSKRVDEVFKLLNIVAEKDTSVLLIGETGTGKELLTNVIHQNSKRRNEAIIKVSCAILSKELFESELFGHVKGSFTGAINDKIGRFEQADKGTLYLDDIDDMPLDLQVKLLRVLEEGEIERVGGDKVIKIDIRLIASTKVDLRKLVDEGKFREDLYYRLNVFPVKLPALRERKEDIPELTRHFISHFNQNKDLTIDEGIYEILKEYPFRGNVRELRNISERITLLSQGSNITVDAVPLDVKFPDNQLNCFDINEGNLTEILERIERKVILKALEECSNNKAMASKKLGIPSSTLKSKILKLDIQNR